MKSPIRRIDPLAALSALIALLMTVVYVAVIRSQGDDSPAWWVLAVLIGAAGLAGAGARQDTARRAPMLAVAGALLLLLGFLAIFSIGLPVVAAGLLALVAAVRASQGPPVGAESSGRPTQGNAMRPTSTTDTEADT